MRRATVDKYSAVVSSVLGLTSGSEPLGNDRIAKLMKDEVSMKPNIKTRYAKVFDLNLVWFLVAALTRSTEPQDIRLAAIVALRASTGWRNEMANISLTHGVAFKKEEMWLRYFNGKTTNNGWSRWTIFKKSADPEICTVRLMQRHIETLHEGAATIQVPDPSGPGKVQDQPIFVSVARDSKGAALKPITISQMCKRALSYLRDEDGDLASLQGKSRFGAHAFRTAVASYASTVGVEVSEVQNRVHSSSDGVLNKHYLIPVNQVTKHEPATSSLDDILRGGYHWWRQHADVQLDPFSDEGWKQVLKRQRPESSAEVRSLLLP